MKTCGKEKVTKREREFRGNEMERNLKHGRRKKMGGEGKQKGDKRGR